MPWFWISQKNPSGYCQKQDFGLDDHLVCLSRAFPSVPKYQLNQGYRLVFQVHCIPKYTEMTRAITNIGHNYVNQSGFYSNISMLESFIIITIIIAVYLERG